MLAFAYRRLTVEPLFKDFENSFSRIGIRFRFVFISEPAVVLDEVPNIRFQLFASILFAVGVLFGVFLIALTAANGD